MFSRFGKSCMLMLALLSCGALCGDEVKMVTPDLKGPGLPAEIVRPKQWKNAPWKVDNGVLRSPDYSVTGMSGFDIGSPD